ncbi:MAG: phosphopantetheine-binding protein [Caulobacter sp.]
MSQIPQDDAVAAVIQAIRDAVAEDWIQDEQIEAQTQFDRDLQLESIEMVKIVQLLQERFDGQADLVQWFAARSFHDLVDLDVATLATALTPALQD